ncbi:Major facilitator superfamily (MFS) profile domain-containing protein [Caenorhabditis elegans]|uniref:Major facilitator superfamily (MFS) profile domain-containing protein n=1 Tax=Caenorhabditis elegans TaxID=6239 RepID=Q19442_CAEEL|nr:Major facilitator superfamily (MFS) profile domain-containing protein [Caenorhabditis elegans]CCD64779.1 Major facilitator superfamily (MFS) profile domain-containing protein [Caenorhabditis elegans]|eukprot:NP_509167.2 Patterned Expression Site [Caenorhabditis elegans]
MLNWHELRMLMIFQVAMIFMVQNVFQIYSTFGQQLKSTDDYLQQAERVSKNDFYRFINNSNFYSTHAQWITDDTNVSVLWWENVIAIQQVGIFVGSILFGYISDHFGRQKVCQYSLLISSVILLVEGFLSSTILIALCRFIIGTQTGAIIVVSWSLTTELISPRTRFLARAFANWPTGKFALALICFFSQNWRISLHVCAAFTLFGALLYIFFVPESPTYLQCHGKRTEAHNIVADVFKNSNGKCVIALPGGIRSKPLTFRQIWKKEKYRNVIILFGSIWVMTNFTATMLDFSEVIIFHNNLILSQMLLAGVPAICKILLGLVEIYFGIISRRNLHLISLCINGISMCASGVLILFGLQKNYPTIYVLVFLIGYASIEFIWDACYLCVVEQVPTEVRGTISGACSFLSRLSGILASKMTIVKQRWEPAPLFIAFATAIIHFLIAFFFLNESKDANLGEIGFTLRRISQKVSQKIHQIRNMTKKEKQPSESTVPAVSKIRKNDISGPVLAEIQLGEGNNVP